MRAKIYEYKGKQYTLNQLASFSEASAATIKARINTHGLSIEAAVDQPLKGVSRKRQHSDGYVYLCGKGNQKGREHIKIAESVLGRPLPKGAVVHHIDGNRSNNKKANLCIFPSHSYHALIHARQNALNISGNANNRKCPFCKKYDAPENMRISSGNRNAYHRACHAEYYRKLRLSKATKGK